MCKYTTFLYSWCFHCIRFPCHPSNAPLVQLTVSAFSSSILSLSLPLPASPITIYTRSQVIHKSILASQGDLCVPPVSLHLYIASLDLQTAIWLSFKKLLLSRYKWIHTIFVFLDLSHHTQDADFSSPTTHLIANFMSFFIAK